MLCYKRFIGILLICIILVSCKTVTQVKEIPVETIRTEYKDKIIKDSIYLRDSIHIVQKGDTIYSTQVKYRYIYKNRIDTIIKTDTIPNIITVTNTEIQNKLYDWQKILMVIGISSILLFIYCIVKYFREHIKL